jgi:hypothetical protein
MSSSDFVLRMTLTFLFNYCVLGKMSVRKHRVYFSVYHRSVYVFARHCDY